MAHLTSKQISAYLDGELDVRQEHALQSHIEQCADCACAVDKVREAASFIDEALTIYTPAQSPRFHADLVHALNGALNSTAMQSLSSWKSAGRGARKARLGERSIRRSGRRLAISSAAAVVCAVGVGWMALQHHTNHLTPAPSGQIAVGGTGADTRNATSTVPFTNTSQNGSQNGSQNAAAVGGTAPLLATTVDQKLSGEATVAVTSTNGSPLAGVHVALIANGRILSSEVSGATGRTPRTDITLPVDAALAPLYLNAGSVSPSADLVVVAWKNGYQPIVAYDVRVFEGGTSQFEQSLVMQPAAAESVRAKLGGYGFGNDVYSSYHLLTGGALADWLKGHAARGRPASKIGSNATGSAVTGAPGGAAADAAQGGLTIHVVDKRGRPVTGAHVNVVAGASVTQTVTTDSDGSAGTLRTPGMDDWRFAGPWNVSGPPRIATVVVWKTGYASAVGFFQPVVMGQDRSVTVTLSSYAWRKAHGWDNNIDAASGIAGARLPRSTDAERFVQWASGQSY